MIIVMVLVGASCVGFVGGRQGANHTGEMVTGEDSGTSGGGEEVTGPIPPSCGGVIEKAQAYLNRSPHIVYSQRQPHCGSFRDYGPGGITWLDCSGFASRAYRDAGLNTSCFTTMSIRSNSQFVKVASTVAQAKNILSPGDLIVIEGHVVIFVGWSGSSMTVYESTPSGLPGGGPIKRVYRDYFGRYGRRFVGVYRSTKCGDTSKNMNNTGFSLLTKNYDNFSQEVQ